MLTAVVEELVRGPQTDAVFGKHLVIEPCTETSRAGRYTSQALVVTTAARRIMELSKAGEKIKRILVIGKNDPTWHPDFREISENLRELTNKWFPRGKLELFSDLPRLDHPDIRPALVCYDRAHLRFEAGTQKTYAALTGADGKDFKHLVEDLGSLDLPNLYLRARFVRGAVDNSTDNEFRAWLRYVESARPQVVEISTLAKADPATKLKPITKTRMGQITERVAEKLGLTPEVLDPE